MKTYFALTTLTTALLFTVAAHASPVRSKTTGEIIDQYNQGSLWVRGYIAGIAEADDKVCSGEVRFSTMAGQVVSTIQAAIDASSVADAAKFKANAAPEVIRFTLETLYPCK